jgi:leucine dehydrogenase
VIRDDTIPELKCRVVAGAANNQLERPEHGDALAELGILYAPDFVINAGGLINVADELIGYDRERAIKKVEDIYRTLREVFRRARLERITPAEAAIRMAEDRMARVSRIRLLWVPRQVRADRTTA